MTKINKLHFNGVDYDIGDKDIHDLTEKTILNVNDEIAIADSNASYASKKIKAEYLAKYVKGTISYTIGAGYQYTDFTYENTNSGAVVSNEYTIPATGTYTITFHMMAYPQEAMTWGINLNGTDNVSTFTLPNSFPSGLVAVVRTKTQSFTAGDKVKLKVSSQYGSGFLSHGEITHAETIIVS